MYSENWSFSDSESSSVSGLDDTTLDSTYDIAKDPDFIAIEKRQNRAEKPINGSEEASSNQIIEEQPRLYDQQVAGPSMPHDMDDDPVIEKKSTRKRHRKPETWKRNIRKTLNNQEHEHVDSTGKVKAKKVPKSVDCSKCRFKCSEKNQ
ncbi:hypothetical protein ElyMa_001036200 [Elysia marginata]|uniref:Uncharacterized protein n=1 Tax=Elysia marginata TaxID=1093978 RepID=A0AAV4HNT3_9GAST|nr:hypothetical protein ElyMa_001036200 [Elysia marginata]